MRYQMLMFVFSLLLSATDSLSQSVSKVEDSIKGNKTSRFEYNLDVISRYLWRGQCWGGDYVAVQPTINFAATDKLSFGFWATTNFKNDYFYSDGITSYKGYQEVDFNISYQLTPFLSLQVWDYYWPTVSPVDGISNDFFNYDADGVKTVDAMLVFDFSEYEFPMYATLSTLVAGNDFRFDENGENPKQNYTTYFEAGYTFEDLYKKIDFDFLAGVVFNNQAEYYTAGDYDKISLVNISMKALRSFTLTDRIHLPISLNYIHNAASRNTEVFGKNFLVAGITISYQ